MRVRIFTKGVALNAASRYRFLHYLDSFRELGLSVEVSPLFGPGYYEALREPSRIKRQFRRARESAKGLARRLGDLSSAKDADLVVVENQLFPYEPGLLDAWLARLKKPTILEFDDAIYETPLHREKLLRLIARASHTIVGNEELARFARVASERVSVVPTTLDMRRYPPPTESPRRAGPFRIGWIGQPATDKYLDLVAEPLRALAKEAPLELVVISGRPIEIAGLTVRFEPWSEAREVALLQDLDAGIMPLSDDPWTRGKCALKLLQYMAAGIPAVASPVGANAQVIRHGENGLLAADARAWYDALGALRQKPEWARELARAGRETVLRDYALAVWAPRLADLYRAVASGTDVDTRAFWPGRKG